jgi:hypothetical protein
LRYINDAAIDSVPNDVAQMSRTDQGDLVQSNRRRPAAQRVIRKKSMSMNGGLARKLEVLRSPNWGRRTLLTKRS